MSRASGDIEISSVGFENGAVIVTLKGVKTGRYLAAKTLSTQVSTIIMEYHFRRHFFKEII